MCQKFSIMDYDCIGFDLDNTILEYHIVEMSKLVYDILARFLIREKGYDQTYLRMPFEEGLPLLQRGLAFDFKKGNIIKLDYRGHVLLACHGSRLMTREKITLVYGPEGLWDAGQKYVSDPLSAWNGPLGEHIRCVLDYFDVTCVLVYARLIDTIDFRSTKEKNYEVAWPDILAGLTYMYDKDGFQSNRGEFFSALREEPFKFIKKCPERVISWLKSLRENGKFLFIITGSAIDFATFTATTAMGSSWKDLFDFVVCFARKPIFFSGNRPFLNIKGLLEGDPCQLESSSTVVSQGNWKELHKFLERKSGKVEPSVVYVGDNAVQDILAPVEHKCCDTLAVCEELSTSNDSDSISGISSVWGGYFDRSYGSETFWNSILLNNAIFCAPSIAKLSELPPETRFNISEFLPK